MRKEQNQQQKILCVTKDAIGRNDLRAMTVGQEIEFTLPDKNKMESARSACVQMKLEGMKFATRFVVEPDRYGISIKRLV